MKCGWLVLIDFDVTMGNNFWQAGFSEIEIKSNYKIKKNHFPSHNVYVFSTY